MRTNRETGENEWQYLDKDEWFKIEKELGKITDVEVLNYKSDEKTYLKLELRYKSNGEEKSIYFSNWEPLLQSIIYCSKEFDPRASKNHQKQ